MKLFLLAMLASVFQIANAKDLTPSHCKETVLEQLSANPKLKDYYLEFENSQLLQPGETIFIRADDWPNTQKIVTEAIHVEASMMGVLMYIVVVQVNPKTCEPLNMIFDKIDFD